MLGIMIAFFGTVIAVNVTMAVFATRTFGGTVVDNSYVASQKFNGWLAQAREQEALGWSHDLRLDGERRVIVALSDAGGPLDSAILSGFARHPLGQAAEIPLRFVAVGDGTYRTDAALPTGRWYLHFTVARDGRQARFVEQLG